MKKSKRINVSKIDGILGIILSVILLLLVITIVLHDNKVLDADCTITILSTGIFLCTIVSFIKNALPNKGKKNVLNTDSKERDN